MIRFLPVATLLALVMATAACSRNCVPEALSKSSKLIDLCAGPDAHAPVAPGLLKEVEAEFQRRGQALHPPGAKPYHCLALSGGGFYGSYGIGMLNGWTAAGTRPEFDVVTGISTGSLIATFAFLGPQYDAVLRDTQVGVEQSDVIRQRRYAAVPIVGSLFNPQPLIRQIERFATPELMCEVAKAHAAGRRLYVGTTNIDTRGLVIWDMGAIASRGTAESRALYRDIILASCSVPGALPPVRIPVEIDGKTYEELHVDGGVSDIAIFRAFMIADRNRSTGVSGAYAPPGSAVYVVNNGKLYAEPDCVRPRTIPLLGASYRSIIYGKGRDELYRIYLNGLETGVAFRLTAIPQDTDLGTKSLGLTVEDQWKLYETGYKAGLNAPTGDGWRDLPPGSNPAEQALPRAGTKFATRNSANIPAEVSR